MNIIRDSKYLTEKYGTDLEVVNDHIEYISVYLLPHYGDSVCLLLRLQNYRRELHNDTANIGPVLHNLSKILQVKEDGEYLADISQSFRRVRSVWVNGPAGKSCVGVGHAWLDQYVLFDEFKDAEV